MIQMYCLHNKTALIIFSRQSDVDEFSFIKIDYNIPIFHPISILNIRRISWCGKPGYFSIEFQCIFYYVTMSRHHLQTVFVKNNICYFLHYFFCLRILQFNKKDFSMWYSKKVRNNKLFKYCKVRVSTYFKQFCRQNGFSWHTQHNTLSPGC